MMRMYGAVVACLTLVAASGAAAQSVYGCSDLEGRQARASVEGTSGVFYRVNPDLRMFHAFSDESIADLAKLAQALDAHGTTLVYVPMPTKSLAMPDQLPPEAGEKRFGDWLKNNRAFADAPCKFFLIRLDLEQVGDAKDATG